MPNTDCEPGCNGRCQECPANRQQEAADRIEALVCALAKVALVSHHRLAEGGGTVPTGFSCEICEAEIDGPLAGLRHNADCPLAVLNPT